MITRKLGALLRGKATPFQIVAAAVLGAMLGFAPELRQAPGLYGLLLAALLVVNANLGFALLVAGLTRVLSWVAAPVSFEVGRLLLDGPTEGLARTVVNAPVFAWCGLSYYAVAGGQVLGAFLGLALGFATALSVRTFQRRMAAAAGNPSRLREVAGRPWAKAVTWIFFGGRAKGTWEDVLAKRVGNPVRVLGLVAVALVGGAAWYGHGWIARSWARESLSERLALVNGATADVGEVELDFARGQFGLRALALADPEALTRDLFRAEELAAHFDQVDILRRRVHMGRLAVVGARSGADREVPGERTVKPPKEEPPGPGGEGGLWSLEDVLRDAEVWRGRLAQAQRLLERLSGGRTGGAADDEGFTERAARRAREAGWFTVEATQLVDAAPTFRLSELAIEGLRAEWLPGRLLDLRGLDLSTQPWLLDAAPKLSLRSRDGAIAIEVDLGPVSRAGGPGALRFAWNGLAVDEILGLLRVADQAPLAGGRLDLAIDGAWAEGTVGVVDLPLRATFRGTTFSLPGLAPTTIDELTLPIGLSGPLDALTVRFEGERLAQALLAAGKAELANRWRGKLTESLDGALGDKLQGIQDRTGLELPPGTGSGLGEKLEGGAKDLLRGALGGQRPK